MSEASDIGDVKCDTVCDVGKSINSKQCNKFSIENILGLKDDTKANRLMDFCRKGSIESHILTSLPSNTFALNDGS